MNSKSAMMSPLSILAVTDTEPRNHFFQRFLYNLCVRACVRVRVARTLVYTCASGCPQRPEEDVGFPRAGVTGS